MRYIVDRCGHRESFKSLRAAKESMKWLGSGYYTLIDTKKNTETLYFSLGNNVFRVKWATYGCATNVAGHWCYYFRFEWCL